MLQNKLLKRLVVVGHTALYISYKSTIKETDHRKDTTWCFKKKNKEVNMLGYIIFWGLFLITFSLAFGRVLGELFWTPPTKEKF